jgi:hypothetical protein
MNHSNKDGTSLAEREEGRLLIKENTFSSGTHPTQSGSARVPRVGECAASCTLARYLSEIRTGCAKERPSGSVRGAISNGCPYRDFSDGEKIVGISETYHPTKPGFFLFPANPATNNDHVWVITQRAKVRILGTMAAAASANPGR